MSSIWCDQHQWYFDEYKGCGECKEEALTTQEVMSNIYNQIIDKETNQWTKPT